MTELERFVLSSRWIFAKTYAKFAPHEYTLLFEAPDRELYFVFLRAIREHGIKALFKGREYQYLLLGDYYYWTMWKDDKKAILINRASLKLYELVNNEWTLKSGLNG